MSKQEATRLADALDAYGETTAAESNLRAKVSALLRRWPDGEPVAWVDDLTRPQPHCVTDLKYCSVAQHERGDHLNYVPLYTAPPDQSERIAALEAALKVAGEALDEMQYARTDKAERLTAEALRKIEEVRK